MKKLLTFWTIFVLTISVKAQSLDTVNVSLTLRAQDWAWAIGTYGEGEDSASRSKVRQIRTAIIAANPATWATTVQVTNLSGRVVIKIYQLFMSAPFGTVLAMGSTTAERTTIYTNIRAISNSALQYFIGQLDAYGNVEFIRARDKGKSIVMDN